MSYVGALFVHDADSHVMERPDWLLPYADRDVAERLGSLWMRGLADFAAKVLAGVSSDFDDPHGRAVLEARVLERKSWWALGACDPVQRSRALDLLGVQSQLVFSTYSSRALLSPIHRPARADLAEPPEPLTEPAMVYGAARAHNRAMAAFCAHDDRLLPVGWVPLDDPRSTLSVAREALEVGCVAIEVPSEARGPRAISHVEHELLWTLLEEAGRPLIFHLGSGGDVPGPVFANTGRGVEFDPDGNADPLRKLRVIALAAPVELALAALIFDGVLERHPNLMVGVIEHGATWVPGFLRRLDLAFALDSRTWRDPSAPRELPRSPSDYVLRQMRFTPFPDEPLSWIMDQSDPSLYMFSTDFPHGEGGNDPLGAFMPHLAERPGVIVDAFLHANFESLMSGSPARAASTHRRA